MNKDEALTLARNTFLEYARQHKEKGKHEKAASNYLLALKIEMSSRSRKQVLPQDEQFEEYVEKVCVSVPRNLTLVADMLLILDKGPISLKRGGVCLNTAYGIPATIREAFPGYTGNHTYFLEPKHVFNGAGKWAGERKELRYRFVKFVLDKLCEQ